MQVQTIKSISKNMSFTEGRHLFDISKYYDDEKDRRVQIIEMCTRRPETRACFKAEI